DALLASHADQRTEDIVIQLTGQLTVEIAELEIFVIYRAGFGELTAEAQAVGQPKMRLGGFGVDLDGLAGGFDGLRIEGLETIGLGDQGEGDGVGRLALEDGV